MPNTLKELLFKAKSEFKYQNNKIITLGGGTRIFPPGDTGKDSKVPLGFVREAAHINWSSGRLLLLQTYSLLVMVLFHFNKQIQLLTIYGLFFNTSTF